MNAMLNVRGRVAVHTARVAVLLIVLLMQTLPSPSPIASASTPAAPTPGDAEAPLRRYLDTLLVRAIEGRLAGETPARAFYNEALSDLSRARVGEEEFAAFWTALADRHRAVLIRPTFSRTLLPPLEGEIPGQVLIPVTARAFDLSDSTFGIPLPVLIGCSAMPDPRISSPGECSRAAPGPAVDAAHNINAVYRVHWEGGAWKLVLHDGLIAEMRRHAAGVDVRRYSPDAELRDDGLTIRVTDVIMRSDLAVLRLSIANDRDEEIALMNPLSLATLVDERGAQYDTRLLRSEIPRVIPAHSSVAASVAFHPLPPDARHLTLVIPDIVISGESRTLRMVIELMRLPFASAEPRPIPGQPALVHALLLLRRVLVTDAQLAAVYRAVLAEETRAEVSEAQFIRYHQAEAADDFLCRLNFPYDFAIAPPKYGATKEEALVTVQLRGPNGMAGTETLTYRLRKESGTWRVAPPPGIVHHMAQWRPAASRSVVTNASVLSRTLIVAVREVVLTASSTQVKVDITNRSSEALPLKSIVDGAVLSDRWGRGYPLHRVPGEGTVVSPQSTASVVLDFFPAPVESRRIVLTVTDPTVVLPVSVPTPLGCP